MSYVERRLQDQSYKLDRKKIEARGRQAGLELDDVDGREEWDQELMVLKHLIEQEVVDVSKYKQEHEAPEMRDYIERVAPMVREQVYEPAIAGTRKRMQTESADDPMRSRLYTPRETAQVYSKALAEQAKKVQTDLSIEARTKDEFIDTNDESIHNRLEKFADLDEAGRTALYRDMRYAGALSSSMYLERAAQENPSEFALKLAVERYEFAVAKNPDFDLQKAGYIEVRRSLMMYGAALAETAAAANITDLKTASIDLQLNLVKELLNSMAITEARVTYVQTVAVE